MHTVKSRGGGRIREGGRESQTIYRGKKGGKVLPIRKVAGTIVWPAEMKKGPKTNFPVPENRRAGTKFPKEGGKAVASLEQVISTQANGPLKNQPSGERVERVGSPAFRRGIMTGRVLRTLHVKQGNRARKGSGKGRVFGAPVKVLKKGGGREVFIKSLPRHRRAKTILKTPSKGRRENTGWGGLMKFYTEKTYLGKAGK